MGLGSMFCFASPPETYAFTLSARSAAKFLRFSFGSAFPTTTSLASGSCCSLSATSSSSALQVLSTRHSFFTFGYWHSFTLVASGAAGGGGFSTVTELVAETFNPRESVQVALTVIGPEDAPVVFNVPVFPLPEMLPLLALHPPTVTGTLSGLVQLQVIVDVSPGLTVDGLAEQDICGGFLGGSFTVKFAVQFAVLFLLAFGSVTVAVVV